MHDPRRDNATAGNGGAGKAAGRAGLHTHPHLTALAGERVPANWRDRLPDPGEYYSAHVGKLSRPNGDGWAQGKCPLHDDHEASLSVQVGGRHGGWRCFAGCGKGDMVAFHMHLRGCDFKAAVRELVRGGA